MNRRTPKGKQTDSEKSIVARIISFVVLVVILLLIGGLFFQVMAGFLLPLFLALLLVIMFRPLHQWFVRKCGRHERIAALLTTGSILALVFVPMSFLFVEAAGEAQSVYHAAYRAATTATSADQQNSE